MPTTIRTASSANSTRKPPARASARDRVRTLVTEARHARPVGSARAEALLALITRRRQRIVEDFYDIGEALSELLHHKLFVKLGYATFDEMLEAREVLSRAQAYKLMAVVSAYSRDRALELGLEKSFAVITYAAATPSHMVPELVARTGIDGRDVAKLSTRDIEAATKALRARTGKGRAVSPAMKHAHDLASRWAKQLHALGLKHVAVSVHELHGKFVVDARVDLETLERLEGEATRAARGRNVKSGAKGTHSR
jgi:hypothetical protein